MMRSKSHSFEGTLICLVTSRDQNILLVEIYWSEIKSFFWAYTLLREKKKLKFINLRLNIHGKN